MGPIMDRKKQLVEELLAHLDESQGGDLESLVKSKAPPHPGLEPKGISVEKIDVMKPKGPADAKIDAAMGGEDPAEEAAESPLDELAEGGEDDKMTDDELKELLQKYLS